MKIVIYIYNGMTMLDAIGPYELLRNMEDAQIQLVARKKGEIIADSHAVHLNAKYSIDEVQEADILLIPGSGMSFVREAQKPELLQWIRQINETTKYTTSVCTGSIILAATGLLKGLKATSHWKPLQMLNNYGAIPTKERIVQEGKFITAAGVSAGIDMALYLLNEVNGEQVARAAQLAIEYDPDPMFNSGNVDQCSPETVALADKKLELGAMWEAAMWAKLKQKTQ